MRTCYVRKVFHYDWEFYHFPEKRISGGLYYVLLLLEMQISSVFPHKIYSKRNINTFYHCHYNLTKYIFCLNQCKFFLKRFSKYLYRKQSFFKDFYYLSDPKI